MQIDIYYCAACNFEPRAAGLAEELLNTLGIEARLIAGTNGVFDVVVDGERIFSRRQTSRFPEPGEITGMLSALL